MNMGMQGIDGVQQRMEELRNRISSKFHKETKTLQQMPDPDFQKQLDMKQEGAKLLASLQNGGATPLMGQIGATSGNLLTPMRPFGLVPLNGGMDKASIQTMLQKVASEENIDYNLLDAITNAESNYNPTAQSGAGAQGLMQLMPATAKSLGVKDPFDPEQNARGAAKYLKGLIAQYGDVAIAVAAYNAGPGNVKKYGGIPPFKETQDYVKKVMGQINSAENRSGIRG